jgi:hypothetical protein
MMDHEISGFAAATETADTAAQNANIVFFILSDLV